MSLIILDRDGVINHNSAGVITSPADWVPIDGSLEAIARLNQAGFRVVVITRQPGINDGQLDVETLTKIHSKMRRMLAQVGGKIEAILFCPHDTTEDCSCWLPLEGAFQELGHRLRIDLTNVPAVGASLNDVHAAQAVGARTLLVRTGYQGQTVMGDLPSGVEVYDDLASVADWLLDIQF